MVIDPAGQYVHIGSIDAERSANPMCILVQGDRRQQNDVG